MLSTAVLQKSFFILTIVVSTAIFWRTVGASVVNALCRLFNVEPIVQFENIDIFKELVNLAMAMLTAMVGAKVSDRVIDYKTKCNLPQRDPNARTRKEDENGQSQL